MDNKHDKGYKELLQVKKIFVELLRSFVKQGWVSKINEDAVERVDRSFILHDFREKEADLVYRVMVDGTEVFLYRLLELQSTVDYQMPYRLLQYMLEIWRSILKDTEKKIARRKEFKLPVIVPCVLYNGKDNWTVCRSFRETLVGNEIFDDYILDFKYILFDVKRYDENMLLELANVIGTVFFIDQRTELDEVAGKLKQLMTGISRLEEDGQALFMKWFKNVFIRGLSGEKADELKKVIEENKEWVSMVYAIEEALRKEFRKHRDEGIKEGKTEGIFESKIEDILELLEDIGYVNDDLRKKITGVTELETLKKWLKLAARVNSIDAFMERISVN